MIDPEVARRAAIGSALDDIGLMPGGGDEDLIEDFLTALKDHGYVVVRDPGGDPERRP